MFLFIRSADILERFAIENKINNQDKILTGGESVTSYQVCSKHMLTKEARAG